MMTEMKLLVVMAVASAVLFVIRGFIFSRLRKKEGEGGLRLYTALRVPSFFWMMALGILITVKAVPLPPGRADLISTIIQSLLLFSVTVAVANIAIAITQRFLARHQSPLAESGLIRGMIRFVVLGLGILLVLDKLGIQIGPLLTALGVGGVAAALAFKDTLENLFSGIQLLVDQTIEVGDFIKIESGQEGVLRDIGWRTSKVDMASGELLVIPNTKLAQTVTVRKAKAVGASKKPSIAARA